MNQNKIYRLLIADDEMIERGPPHFTSASDPPFTAEGGGW